MFCPSFNLVVCLSPDADSSHTAVVHPARPRPALAPGAVGRASLEKRRPHPLMGAARKTVPGPGPWAGGEEGCGRGAGVFIKARNAHPRPGSRLPRRRARGFSHISAFSRSTCAFAHSKEEGGGRAAVVGLPSAHRVFGSNWNGPISSLMLRTASVPAVTLFLAGMLNA